jgi:hypothetical protein
MLTRSVQDLFVDRLRQLDRFRRSLDGSSERRIILIKAGSGMGKSWLLRQFSYEARERGARSVLIDFSDGQAYDVLTLLRRFRDGLGAADFNELTRAINTATAPRLVISDDDQAASTGLQLGADSTLTDVQIGDVAGRNIIKDNQFIIQAENPQHIQAIEDRVTQVFFTCLDRLTAHTQVVFLFDTYERNSQERERWVAGAADRWIRRELLERVRDGRLQRGLIVLAGRRLPGLGPEWNRVAGQLQLEGLTVEDVAQYLRENRRLVSLSADEIQTLYTAVQGNPQLLGIIGDNLEQALQPVQDDW